MSTEVETVVTETPAAEVPIGKDAFKAARAEVQARSQSRDQVTDEEAPVTDDTTPKTPAQEPAKPADEPTAAGEPDESLLSPEEVSKLSAGDKKLYEKAQKAFTQKTQKIAAERKEFEDIRKQFDEWKPLIEAAQRGEITRVTQPTTQDTKPVETVATTETLAELPEEWKFLSPLFETHAKRVRQEVLAEMRGELAPIKQAHDIAVSNAVAAETQAEIDAMTSRHSDWKQYEKEIIALGSELQPSAAMDTAKYMDYLYEIVKARATAKTTEADKTKAVIDKLNKVAANSEPVIQGADSARVEHVMPKGLTNSAQRLREAAKAAKRGERWVVND